MMEIREKISKEAEVFKHHCKKKLIHLLRQLVKKFWGGLFHENS
jgi:hypothetical protein